MSSSTRTILVRYAALGAACALASVAVIHADAAASPKGRKAAAGATAKPASVAAGKPSAGAQVFAKQCASCHGAKGEGTKQYNKLLVGDRSVNELARYIAQYMPPGAPKKLPAAKARQVAAFIHDAFYSTVAQARNKPARIELSHLTVGQYRNAVTDLIGSFRAAGPADERRRGLRGEYFKAGRMRGDQRILERIDPEVRFDFKAAGALPQQDDPYQFAMRWEGSVLAPDTGEYEFIVRTEHAARLWVNNLQKPLVDALIKSGDGKEYRASIFLIAGRLYPLRLEFSKGVQGVNNLAKLKEKPAQPASIALEWKRPKLAAETIPQRSLIPALSPEVFVSATPFPPDDRSIGYERGNSISKAWAEATTEGALETAQYVADHLGELAGVNDAAADRDAKVRAFCRRFVERAFRRPLSDELASMYVDRHFQGAPDLETGVKRVVLLTLKSPRFLYREIGGGTPDGYDVASRLSFALWDSLPDETLLKAAAAGELATREQVARQAERMSADLRARAKLREFFLQWLKVDQYPDLAKDPKKFPGFDEAVAADLRTSLELTLDSIVGSPKSDFRELLLSDKVYLNGRLGRVYGAPMAPGAPFRQVSLDYGKRTGVLTHPYLLASFAYVDSTSPIHRGVLIARSVLGRVLQPPPQAFVPLAADLHPKMTTRERVAMQTKPAACSSCHNLINPLGFSLEKFDAIGRIRSKENGRPIDPTGGYYSRSGKEVKFTDSRDLARFLAGSEEVHAAFVEKLFQNLVKQPVRAFGPRALPGLRQSFAANQFNIRKQMVETAVLSALERPVGTLRTTGADGTSRQPQNEGSPRT